MASIGKSALAHATSIVWGSLQVIVWVSPSKGLGRGDNSCLSHSVLISHLGQLTSSVLVSAVASEVSLLRLLVLHGEDVIEAFSVGLSGGLTCLGSCNSLILLEIVVLVHVDVIT